MVEEFIDKVKFITDKDLVWNFEDYSQVLNHGKHPNADGMDTDRFWNNLICS